MPPVSSLHTRHLLTLFSSHFSSAQPSPAQPSSPAQPTEGKRLPWAGGWAAAGWRPHTAHCCLLPARNIIAWFCATTVPLHCATTATADIVPGCHFCLTSSRLPRTLDVQILCFSSHFRLVQQPNCIKVPKEVCVNERTNPKKVKIIIELQCPLSPTINPSQVTRPVVKEWCYRPADLKSPTSRLALSQFFSKN